jgi:hypothetical protein
VGAEVARRRKARVRQAEAPPAPPAPPAAGAGGGKALDGLKPKRLDQKLNAILRGLYVDPELLPYPERLTVQRFHMYAQNEEDGLVLALLKEAGITSRTFVEIGCGENGGNSGFLAHELGFRGLMLDGSKERVRAARQRFNADRVTVRQAFVTRENVDALIGEAGLAGEIDFLSVDVDGVDVWLFDAVRAVSPRIVAVEFNSLFGAEKAVSVPYKPDFSRRDVEPVSDVKRLYYGVSLRGIEVAGRRRGYRLVVVEPRGNNAFLLRDDVAPHVPATSAADLFRQLNKNQVHVDAGFDIFAVAERHDLELVDLERA